MMSECILEDGIHLNGAPDVGRFFGLVAQQFLYSDLPVWLSRQFLPAEFNTRSACFRLSVAALGTCDDDDFPLAALYLGPW